MHPETMIPVLPCVSLGDTFAFYRLLGFEVTYEQSRPYVYGSVRRGGMEVHFAGSKDHDPRASWSTCLVIVPEVEQLHTTFAGALRDAYGKLPVAGVPRITRMKPGQSRFTVVDVAGNSLIFIKRDAPEEDDAVDATVRRPGETRLAHAVRLATRLRDFKNDDESAAKVLDVALARDEPNEPRLRARALIARVELAEVLAQPDRAAALRAELAALPLASDDRAAVDAELAARVAATRR